MKWTRDELRTEIRRAALEVKVLTPEYRKLGKRIDELKVKIRALVEAMGGQNFEERS